MSIPFFLIACGASLAQSAAPTPDVAERTVTQQLVGSSFYTCGTWRAIPPGHDPATITPIDPYPTMLPPMSRLVIKEVELSKAACCAGFRVKATFTTNDGLEARNQAFIDAEFLGSAADAREGFAKDLNLKTHYDPKARAIQKGMNYDELQCVAGFPDTKNHYGSSGYQYVYRGGDLIVYLDEDQEIVQDFTELNSH